MKHAGWLLLLLCALPAVAEDDSQLPALWAVVVGVSDYKHLAPPGTPGAARTDLNFAHRDAEAFADYMQRQQATGAYRSVNIRLLSDSAATKEEVITAIEDGLVEARNDDLVVIYFAGHGVPDAAGAEYLLLWDSREDRLSATAYRMNDLWTRLKDRIRAEKAIVILDACHAGALGAARGPGTNAAASFQRYLSDARGRALLAATREGQSAYEDPVTRHGYFTKTLLDGLERAPSDAPADFNRDGIVLLSEAFEYVYDRVRQMTESRQLPDFKGDVTGMLPIAITSVRGGSNTRTASAPALVITTAPVRARIFLQGPEGMMEDMGVAPVLRKVPPGKYTVVAIADGYVDAEKTVEVGDAEIPVGLMLVTRPKVEKVKRETLLDFESGADPVKYLAASGVKLEAITGGTELKIMADYDIYQGAACIASSGSNLITQAGSNDPVSFTVSFEQPCSSVSFTRPKLLTGPSGITHPEWKVQAFGSDGAELDAVSEELIRSFVDVPAARFTLKGGLITSVKVSSNNHHFAAFNALLIDDLTLEHAERVRPPSAVAVDGFSLDAPRGWEGDSAGNIVKLTRRDAVIRISRVNDSFETLDEVWADLSAKEPQAYRFNSGRAIWSENAGGSARYSAAVSIGDALFVVILESESEGENLMESFFKVLRSIRPR